MESEVGHNMISRTQLPTDLMQNKSTTAIETVFPEVLREPILRKVQFSTISRVDDLGKFRARLDHLHR